MRPESLQPHTEQSSRSDSEPSSVEADVYVWCYALLVVHARKEKDILLCLVAVRTGSLSSVPYDTLATIAAVGLMSSLRRLKTCRLRRTVKKRLIALIYYSVSQKTCT